MANSTPAHAPPPAAGPPPPGPHSPGGLASDPSMAVAAQISSIMKGLPERMQMAIANSPALKAVVDQTQENLVADIAQTIRVFVASEIAKVTGGTAPKSSGATGASGQSH